MQVKNKGGNSILLHTMIDDVCLVDLFLLMIVLSYIFMSFVSLVSCSVCKVTYAAVMRTLNSFLKSNLI